MDKKSQTADPQHETYWATKTRQPEAEIRGAKRYLSLLQKLWGERCFHLLFASRWRWLCARARYQSVVLPV
jgi:hypothetical protein